MEINIDDLLKVDLRVGKIIEAERIEESDKLLKLKVDIGEEERQILAGIGKQYDPEDLINSQVIIVANLKPREMAGSLSQGMLLAVKNEESKELAVLTLDKEVPPGSKVS